MDRRAFLGGAIVGSTAFAAAKAEQTKGEVIATQYAIVELMGFKKLCGRLSQGFAGLLQLDVPVAGGVVTKMINPASIYAITIVDEEVVKSYAAHVDPLPAIELDVAAVQRRLPGDRWGDDDVPY